MPITRKDFLKKSLTTFAGILGLAHAPVSWGFPAIIRKHKPNILMIVTDQERSWSDIPDDLAIPARRSLAENATHFGQCHVNTLPCTPSRSVIWTGQHVQHTGVYSLPYMPESVLKPEKTLTIAQMLKEQGYCTANKGKWHLSRFSKLENYKDALKPFGYDEWQKQGEMFGGVLEGFNQDAVIAQEAARFIEHRALAVKENGPWFLSVNLINPHDVMWFDATGQQQQSRLYKGYVSQMKGAPDSPPFNQDLGYALPASFKDTLADKPEAQRAFLEVGANFYGHMPRNDEAAYKRLQNFYFNCLRHNDKYLGQILHSLKTSRQEDNTIVLFTSDHGEMAGAHGLRNKGPFLYKENVRVPLLIRHPDISTAKSCNTLTSSIDIVPTLLELTGIQSNDIANRYPALKGLSCATSLESPFEKGIREKERGGALCVFDSPTFASPKAHKKGILALKRAQETGLKPKRLWPNDYIDFDSRGFGRAIFDGRYKFGRWFSPAEHHRPASWSELPARNDLELYDTYSDPHEMINLAKEPDCKELLLSMNNKLNSLITEEIGDDDGAYLPGAPSLWRTSSSS